MSMPRPRYKKRHSIFEQIPLLRVLLAYIFGVLAAYYAPEGWQKPMPWLWGAVAAALIYVALLYFTNDRSKGWRRASVVLLSAAFLFAGGANFLFFFSKIDTAWTDQAQTWQAEVTHVQKVYPGARLVRAELHKGEHNGKTVQLYLQGTKADSLQTGCAIAFSARISTPKNQGNPDEFDYASYLRRQGVAGTAYCDSVHWMFLGKHAAPTLLGKLAMLRNSLLGRLAQYCNADAFPVLAAMTLGSKLYLSSEVRDVFSQTGASHVLALSGLHLGILFGFLSLLISPLRPRRRLYAFANIFLLLLMWLFVGMAGHPLSLIRAAVMLTVMQACSLLSRDSNPLVNLSLAAFIILLFSPQALFDAGFQLSFLSVFFILYRRPIYDRRKTLRQKVLFSFYQLFTTSLRAQIGTAPLVAFHFHVLPLLALPVSFIVIPLAYLLLVLSACFFLLPFMAMPIAAVLNGLVFLLNSVLAWVSSLPGSCLQVAPTACTVVGCYALYYCVLQYRRWRLPRFVYLAALVIAICAAAEYFEARRYAQRPFVVVYNVRRAPCVHFVGEQSYIYSAVPADSTLLALQSVQRTFWKTRRLPAPQFVKTGFENAELHVAPHVLAFGGRRIAMPVGWLPKQYNGKPLPIDALVVTADFRGTLTHALAFYRPRLVVLHSSLSQRRAELFAREAEAAGIEAFDVSHRGAFILR